MWYISVIIYLWVAVNIAGYLGTWEIFNLYVSLIKNIYIYIFILTLVLHVERFVKIISLYIIVLQKCLI